MILKHKVLADGSPVALFPNQASGPSVLTVSAASAVNTDYTRKAPSPVDAALANAASAFSQDQRSMLKTLLTKYLCVLSTGPEDGSD